MTLAVSGLYSPFFTGIYNESLPGWYPVTKFMIIPGISSSLTWTTGLCHWTLKRNPTNGNFASEASPSNSLSGHVPVFWHRFLEFLSPSCNKINTSQVLANISHMWHQPNGCLKTGATKATNYQFSCLSASSLHLTEVFLEFNGVEWDIILRVIGKTRHQCYGWVLQKSGSNTSIKNWTIFSMWKHLLSVMNVLWDHDPIFLMIGYS